MRLGLSLGHLGSGSTPSGNPNLLTNSALVGGADGTGGSAGTAPTGWGGPFLTGTSDMTFGTRSVSFDTASGGRHQLLTPSISLEANSSYYFSVELSAVSNFYVHQCLIINGALPTGLTLSYQAGGANVGFAIQSPGNVVIGLLVETDGTYTPSTEVFKLGSGVSGTLPEAFDGTLAKPKFEVGTTRTAYVDG